jgi:hypothetical protein
MTATTIRLTARAELQAAAGEGAPRRFKVSPAYSGGKLPGYVAKLELPVVIDLATLTTRGIVTANLDHRQEHRVGHVDDVQNDRKTLALAGIVSAASTSAAEFVASAQRGYPWAASIETTAGKLERIERGQSVTVNGQQFTGPIYVARGAELSGVAFLPQGADGTARAMLATTRRGFPMRPTYDHDPLLTAQLDETVRLHNQREHDLCRMRAGLFPVNLSAAAETEVRAAINATELETETMRDELHLIEARALAGEIDGIELERQIHSLQERDKRLNELRAARPRGITASLRDAPQGELIIAALCLAGGINQPEKHFSERMLDAAEHYGRGLGLQSLLMRAACSAGYHAHQGEYINAGNIQRVLAAAFSPQIQASGFSTLSISNVLSNVANKMLLDGFQEMPSEWRSIAAVKNVNNFKEHTFVRLLDSLAFEEVGSGGEIKHGTLGDDTMTGKALTFAKMLTITRQQIINDDLGALTDVPRRLGRAAAQKFNSLFWTAFVAADSFFDAGNGNVVTGSGTALDSAGVGLTAGIKAFRAQTSPAADGAKLIGGKPSVLLVPPALEIVARRLLNSAGIVSGTTSSMPDGNPFQGLCTLVVEDRLAAASGGSDSVWYLLRAPTFAPAMLVPALNGRVEPVVETAEADFNVLGVSMRGYSDVGVARGEVLCGLQMAGTA